MKTLIVIAGGECLRIADFLKEEFKSIPKHILPLPTRGMTVIEAIVKDAEPFFGEVVIEANYQNAVFFEALFNGHRKVVVSIDDVHSGPLGPVARRLDSEERIYACAGDMFCEFSWAKFEEFHNAHTKSVSILVASSMAVPKGARFLIGPNNDLSWERVEYTQPFDLINIGAYIIDRSPETIDLFEDLDNPKTMLRHKEDGFFDTAIKRGCVNAYNPAIIGFNINTPLTCQGLCRYLKGVGSKRH